MCAFTDGTVSSTQEAPSTPFQRAFSVSDALFARSQNTGPSDHRVGVMAAVESLAHLRQIFPAILQRFPYRQQQPEGGAELSAKEEAMDVINVALRPPPDAQDDEKVLRKYLVPFVEVRSDGPSLLGATNWAADKRSRGR